jgi:hypothetical protein
MTFKGTLVKCESCDEVFRSLHPGHFVHCLCGEAFVDEKPQYMRYNNVKVITPLIVDVNKSLKGRRSPLINFYEQVIVDAGREEEFLSEGGLDVSSVLVNTTDYDKIVASLNLDDILHVSPKINKFLLPGEVILLKDAFEELENTEGNK